MREDGLQMLNSWVNRRNEIRELESRIREKYEECDSIKKQLRLEENAAIYQEDRDHIQAALILAEVDPNSRNIGVKQAKDFLRCVCESLTATLRASASERYKPWLVCSYMASNEVSMGIALFYKGKNLPNTMSLAPEDQPYLTAMHTALAQSGVLTTIVGERGYIVYNDEPDRMEKRQVSLRFSVKAPRSLLRWIDLCYGLIRFAKALNEQLAALNGETDD